MLRHLHLACLAACAAALLLTASPAVAGGCVTFSDLEHCPIGEASLSVSDAGLQVSGVGSGGNDGVAIALPEIRDWEAGFQISGGDNSLRVILGAESGGEEISRAQVVAEDDGTHLSATFTGADGPGTYSILVYDDGILVGSQGGVGSGAGDYVNVNTLPYLVQTDPWAHTGFHNDRVTSGSCVWTFGFAEDLRFTMPDGVELEGDAIHLVEEVGGAGHYPYVAFDGITLRSSRGIVIVVEEPGL